VVAILLMSEGDPKMRTVVCSWDLVWDIRFTWDVRGGRKDDVGEYGSVVSARDKMWIQCNFSPNCASA